MAGKTHRRRARTRDSGSPRVCPKRARHQRPLDDYRRRRPEPLVLPRHELSRPDQHADDVRHHRQVRRRLVPLCRPGKTASAVRLGAADFRARLAPPRAPDGRHVLLLQPHRPVPPRNRVRRRAAHVRRGRRYAPPDHDRLQRQSRTHGLDAECAAVGNQPAGRYRCSRGGGYVARRLCGQRPERRHAGHVLQRSGKPEKLAAQYVYLAFQHFGFFRQRPRIFPEIPARHTKRLDERRRRLPETSRSEAAGRRGRQAGFVHAPGFPHEHHLPVRRRDFPDRHLVREIRSEHVRHAPVHPSVYRSGAAFVAEQV